MNGMRTFITLTKQIADEMDDTGIDDPAAVKRVYSFGGTETAQ